MRTDKTSLHPRHGFDAPDIVTIGYMALMTAVSAAFVDRFPAGNAVVIRFATIMFAYVAAVRVIDRLGVSRTVRLLFCSAALIVSFLFAFMNLGHVIEFLNPLRAEFALMRIDRVLFFGHNPNLVMQEWLNPYVVDAFQIVYASYYPLFLLMLFALGSGARHKFYRYLTSVALLFATQYILYMLVPARSPYVIMDLPLYGGAIELTRHVQGAFVGDVIRTALHSAEALKFDCFPSGHTAGAVLVTMSLFNWNKKAGSILAPWAAALVFSTVYLQYHYVIDVIAGVCLAIVVYYLGRVIADRLPMPEPAEVRGGKR